VGGPGNQQVIAAAERPMPSDIADDWPALLEWLETSIPSCLDGGGFIGKKVVIGLPATWTTVQHVQMSPEEAKLADEVVGAYLPELDEEPMTRVIHVGDVVRDDQPRSELICMAFPRRCVFHVVEMLHRHGLDVVDIRTQIGAMVSAFDHLHRRDSDIEQATMYVDLGTSGTNCAIANGRHLASARRINVGGRHFDQAVARHLGCDLEAARAYRIAHDLAEHDESTTHPGVSADSDPMDRRKNLPPKSLGSPMTPLGLGTGGIVPDCPDLLETIVDELRMAVRYDAGLFPDRAIERIIFLGSGARSDNTCRHIVQALQIPGQRGDPLARFNCPPGTPCPADWNGMPRPDWGVACGLLASGKRSKERSHAA
ncbi:MAG: hypothetical protein VCE43_01600, partial [Myxococcota bacterium]